MLFVVVLTFIIPFIAFLSVTISDKVMDKKINSLMSEVNHTKEKLQQIKARAAEITSITVLAETDTTYDVIVQTMDAVRLIPASDESDGIPGELFPDIGIGSAPPDQRKEGSK